MVFVNGNNSEVYYCFCRVYSYLNNNLTKAYVLYRSFNFLEVRDLNKILLIWTNFSLKVNQRAMNNALNLQLLKQTFAIHSLPPESDIPTNIFNAPIYFIAKTYDEVSVVLPQEYELVSDDVEKNWRALEVVGPLDFTLTGILSRISTILANEKISIFAISTFDTDYILVKNDKIEHAIETLTRNKYQISRD